MDFSPYDIKRAKSYMHAEDESDETITEYLELAAEYLKENGGIVLTDSNPARYRIALRAVALHYYDNRDAGKDVPPLPENTRLLINGQKPYP